MAMVYGLVMCLVAPWPAAAVEVAAALPIAPDAVEVPVGQAQEVALDDGTQAEAQEVAPEKITDLQILAANERAAGRNRKALAALIAAKSLANARSPAPNAQKALLALDTASTLLALGRFEEAAVQLTEADAAVKYLSLAERVALDIERGRLDIEQGNVKAAAKRFADGMALANLGKQPELQATAWVNRIRARLELSYLDLEEDLAGLLVLVNSLPASDRSARLLVAASELHLRAIDELDYPAELRKAVYESLLKVVGSKRASGATRGYAYGFLGAMYEQAKRYDDAVGVTRYALAEAQSGGYEEQVYRWEWQLGRILQAQQEIAAAEAAYARAVQVLGEVRPNFALGSRNTFARLVEPVYRGYADLKLARTATLPAGDVKYQNLREVRSLLEDLKRAEVEDYFASECVSSQGDGQFRIDSGTALIYPVFLDARTELLVETESAIDQFTVAIGRNQMTETIRVFRRNLERVTARKAYLKQSQRLHEWLIAPIQPFLARNSVATLVVIPEGALRTVPISALHDGEQFLVQQYAIATTPSIELTSTVEGADKNNLLVGGLTDSVQGFVGLPNVEREIEAISSTFPVSSMSNQSFRLDRVRSELQDKEYSIAHFATHGQFESDFRQSFLLTYDSKLTLQDLQVVLESRGDEPLDLLVLSACQTAAGDDRAALGLAGVAVQSGARSALASLWQISDAATAELVTGFYAQLAQSSASSNGKAGLLQAAQLELINSDRFQHPSFWAPYLLIGDWR